MSNRLFKALAIVLFAGITVSCDHNIEVKPPFAWGKYDSYDDFLWKKCAPDTLRRTLVFDLSLSIVHLTTQPPPKLPRPTRHHRHI